MFGNEFQAKLMNLNAFIVGAGALGSELLKQSALMGLACDAKGNLAVTDDDDIEISNLNRQFLFRKEHVKKSKAKVACSVAQKMNNDLRVKSFKKRVATENENIFTDEFWDGLNCIINAVDNVHARKYVDAKCLLHNKPLFESGTLGTKANTQMIVPHHTQSYGDSDDPAEEQTPMCTIRNYPYMIDHTIEWARGIAFQNFFVEGTNEFSLFIADPTAYLDACQADRTLSLGTIKERLLILKQWSKCAANPNIKEFVNIGRQLFQDMFTDNIAQLLHCFPHDYKDKEGRPFWTSPKRAPHVIEFNPNDETHFEFIKSVVTMAKFVFKVNDNVSDDKLFQ